MSTHMNTKHKLQTDIKTFCDVINSPLLSDSDKMLLRYIYIDNQNYSFIGDQIGVSESTVKHRHKKLLNKISKIMQAGV